MSLSFSIVMFAFLSPIYQCVAIALYLASRSDRLRGWEITLTLGLWLDTQPLFVAVHLFQRQVKIDLGRAEEHGKSHSIRKSSLVVWQ